MQRREGPRLLGDDSRTLPRGRREGLRVLAQLRRVRGGMTTPKLPAACPSWCGTDEKPADVHAWFRADGRFWCRYRCMRGKAPARPPGLPAAVELGRRGGKARAARMTDTERKDAARKAAQAPRPSRRKAPRVLVISETAAGMWSYHLREVHDGKLYLSGGAPPALCGRQLGWDTQFPLTAWDRHPSGMSAIPETWCAKCSAMRAEPSKE